MQGKNVGRRIFQQEEARGGMQDGAMGAMTLATCIPGEAGP